jgi:hypothetical protein
MSQVDNKLFMLVIVIFGLLIKISICYFFTNVDSDIVFLSSNLKIIKIELKLWTALLLQLEIDLHML